MDVSASLSKKRGSCWGVYETTLRKDARVHIPEHFRRCLGEEVVMVCFKDRTIRVLPVDLLEEWRAALLSEGPSQGRSASAVRTMLAGAEFGYFDSEGCLALTAAHREWAALSPQTSLRILGVGDTIEIWSQAEWEVYQLSDLKERW